MIEFKEANNQYHSTATVKLVAEASEVLRSNVFLRDNTSKYRNLATVILNALYRHWKVTIRSSSDIYVLGKDGVCLKELVLPRSDYHRVICGQDDILQIEDGYNRIIINLKAIEYMELSAIPRNYQGMGSLYAATIKVNIEQDIMKFDIKAIQPKIVDDIFRVSIKDLDNRISDPHELGQNTYIVVSEKQLTNLLWYNVKRNHRSSSQIFEHRYPMLINIVGDTPVLMTPVADIMKIADIVNTIGDTHVSMSPVSDK